MKNVLIAIAFLGFANSAYALTEVQRVQRVYADLNQIKDPNQVPLDAVVLVGEAEMIYPPYSIQIFIPIWNEYQDLGFPTFDTSRTASLWEQGTVCNDNSVQCAAAVIAASRSGK